METQAGDKMSLHGSSAARRRHLRYEYIKNEIGTSLYSSTVRYVTSINTSYKYVLISTKR